MGGSASPQPIDCPANQWTEVISVGGRFIFPATYQINVIPDNLTVKWRRYGAGVPPYWEGDFTGHEQFTIYPWDVYLRVDLMPPLRTTANVSGSSFDS